MPRYYVPLIIFALIGAAFYVGLGLRPGEIPSARIGKPAPDFTMEALYEGEPGFSRDDLVGHGRVLVNIFASWCAPCRDEHPILMALKSRGITIYGMNNRDDPADAKAFIEGLGNAYDLIGTDRDGRIAIDWGVSGYPETFVVSNDGEIIYQHIGPLTRQAVLDIILPLVEGKDE
jgi:cytochrome c biogenesis protein CcmG, thiol:disulfide interchange protein DsbE